MSTRMPVLVFECVRPLVIGAVVVVVWVLSVLTVSVSQASAATEVCPNAVYRTGFASRLPDCRAYEMVTPPYKEGFAVGIETASADGSVLTGSSLGVFAGTQNDVGIGAAPYTFTRSLSGWMTTATSMPVSSFPISALTTVSADGLSGLWIAVTPTQAGGSKVYASASTTVLPSDLVLRAPDGSVADVGPFYPNGTTLTDIELAVELEGGKIPAKSVRTIAGASADLSSVLFVGSYLHWPFDPVPDASQSLYEYVGKGKSEPLLVGVSGGFGSSNVISLCGTELGDGQNREGAVSSPSGTVVFFTALACGSSPAVNELFARVDNGGPGAHTVAISEPVKSKSSVPGDCDACDTEPGVLANAEFQGASADGSKVFFATRQPLLGGDSTNNIYEYDFDSPPGNRIARVSGGDSTVSQPVAEVGEVMRSSTDGSLVYFTARGVLTRTPNGLGQVAEAGRSNLYLFERDARYPNGHTAFMASGEGASALGMSANGRYFTFLSAADLTFDDTSSFSQGFEYDAQTADLVRFTIGQDGYNENGNADNFSNAEGGNGVGVGLGLSSGTILSSVTNDGAVFFSTSAPLAVEAALNGESVYEYHEGNIYLISASPNVFPATFLGTDATGVNVFFETRDQLSPQDGDSQSDVYDARIDGGFPPPVLSAACEGDACQGRLSAAPVLLSPGSEFQAGGNPPLAGPVGAATSVSKAKPKSKKKTKRKRRSKHGKAARARAGERSERSGK